MITQSVERDVLAALIGLCVGSFLNVLALRTLAEKPFWSTVCGFSVCPSCNHRLGPLDLIPLLSYLLLKGKCRYCKEPIAWFYPVTEVITAIAFVAVLHHYQVMPGSSFITDDVIARSGLDISMLTFICILIAVCVTDFKEKLIPHEITYPSIIIGIAYSAWWRDDIMGTLAGIGVSYILFDFLAFYGLKLYYLTHHDEEDLEQLDSALRAKDQDMLATVPTAKATVKALVQQKEYASSIIAKSSSPELAVHHIATISPFEEAMVRSTMYAEAEDTATERAIDLVDSGDSVIDLVAADKPVTIEPKLSGPELHPAVLDEDYESDPQIDEVFELETKTTASSQNSTENEEDFEVMGGGDAVLAALIAAWIGLENLGVTLVFGFMVGALMGSGYLAHELHKRGTLNQALKTTALITGALLLIAEGTVYMFAYNTGLTAPGHEQEFRQLPWFALAAASTFGGILFSTILNGRDGGSKPFPFGPALAVGAVVAIFTDPAKKIQLCDAFIQSGTFLLNMGHN